MAQKKVKLTKTEEAENKKHEKKIRDEVNRIKAVDEFGRGTGEMDNALKKARETLRKIKEARGEDFDNDDVKEVKIASKSTTKKAR